MPKLLEFEGHLHTDLLAIGGSKLVDVFRDSAEGGSGQIKEAVSASLHSKALLGTGDEGRLAGLHILIKHCTDGLQHVTEDWMRSTASHLHSKL